LSCGFGVAVSLILYVLIT